MMPNKHRLPTPELHVVMMDDREFTVQCLNPDLVAWDRDSWRHKWADAQRVPFQWMTYLAWHALTKTHKLLPEMTLADFEKQVASVTSGEPDADDDAAGVDPTPPDLGDG